MDSMLFTGFCPEQAARGEGAWRKHPEPALKALLLGRKRNGYEWLGGRGQWSMVAELAWRAELWDLRYGCMASRSSKGS